jgi:protein TonB
MEQPAPPPQPLAPTAAPAVATAPSPPAQSAPPTPSSAPADPDPGRLARYGEQLSDLLARQQTYPRLAAARGWEGEVLLRVVIARKGNLVAVRVLRSSGHVVLDENARSLVAGVAPFPAPPGPAAQDELEVTVPVRYRLNNKV